MRGLAGMLCVAALTVTAASGACLLTVVGAPAPAPLAQGTPIDWKSVAARLSGIPDTVTNYESFVDHLHLGIAYANTGRLGPAASQFRLIGDPSFNNHLTRILGDSLARTSAQPGDVMAWNCLAFAYYAREDYVKAVECFERLAALDPDNVWVMIYLGYCLGRVGRLDDAISTLRRAVKADPHNEYAHLVLGMAYKEKGMVVQAFFELLKAPHAMREVSEFK